MRWIKWPLALLLGIAVIALGFRLAAQLREHDDHILATARLVSTPLGRVAISENGPVTGEPVLIVHGTAAWSGFWRDISAHLAARGRHVIAVDLPPFGYSDRDPEARYDRRAQALRLAKVIEEVAGQPTTVLAHSFGAGAATELALRAPQDVKHLILVDAALGELDGSAKQAPLALRWGWSSRIVTSATLTNPLLTGRLLRSFLSRKQTAEGWVATVQAPMRRPGTTAAYAAWLPNLFAVDPRDRSRSSGALAAIRSPVSLIWGDADTVTQSDRAGESRILPGRGCSSACPASGIFRISRIRPGSNERSTG